MKKSVEIDGRSYTFEDPYDCLFSYDGIACRYPDSKIECLAWEDYGELSSFPKGCPLKDFTGDE